MRRLYRSLATIYLLICLAAPSWTQQKQSSTVLDLSLEELMNVTVTSATKKAQPLKMTAGSVYVITAEDIHRSGLQSVPELLRLAPGVQVARSDSGTWAISIRGFADEFSNKLLVLVDGRIVYNELFGGVFWGLEEMPVDEIDRIEVVRGPASAMWGANAANGVISIVTKSTDSTRGGQVTAGGGTAERYGGARFGGAMGPKASYRVSVRRSLHDPFSVENQQSPSYGWTSDSFGFRADWNPTASDSLFISGEGQHSLVGRVFTGPTVLNPFPPNIDGRETGWQGSMNGRWQHAFSENSNLEIRAAFEHVEHDDVHVPLKYNTAQLDLQHHWTPGPRHELIWGVTYRSVGYRIDDTAPAAFSFRRNHGNLGVAAIFGEDAISVVPDKLTLIAGVHVSYDDFTHIEVQPTARLLWTPTSNLQSWAAVSRAVRTPSIFAQTVDGVIDSFHAAPPLFGLVRYVGDPNFRSEAMASYEAGQRIQLGKHVALDGSAYVSTYQRLQTQVPQAASFIPPSAMAPAHLDLPLMTTNARYGQSYGAELSALWAVNTRWKLNGGYSWLRLRLHSYPGQPAASALGELTSPRQQFQAHSYLDLTHKIQLDTGLYYYGALPQPGVPRHLRGDARLGWMPTATVELSAGVQDAFEPERAEVISTRLQAISRVRRNFYGNVTFRF